jgi:flavin reductase (DIM6/NTAB) family NADH-FMN oxidoreductase RutF
MPRTDDAARGPEHRVVRPRVLYAGTPVVLLATRNDDGTANLAPASSYWALGQMLALGLETEGHTLANLQARPQLTVNFPSPPLWRAVERIADLTGRRDVPVSKADRYAFHADKFAAAGLTAQPSDLVGPPRVAECLLQLEAEVRRITPGVTGDYAIGEAEVVRVHADPRIIADDEHIDPLAWQPIVYSFRHYFGIGEPLGSRGSGSRGSGSRGSGSHGSAPMEEGGDPACWLASVCPECGAMREGPGACAVCGAAAADD